MQDSYNEIDNAASTAVTQVPQVTAVFEIANNFL